MITRAIRTSIALRGLPAAALVFCLFVQSLIPVGWMPSAGDGVIELCSVHAFAPSSDTGNAETPAKKGTQHSDQICPFASSGLWTRIDSVIGVSNTPSVGIATGRAFHAFDEPARSVFGAPLGSRAPPVLA